MVAFVRSAESGSFVAAGRILGLSASAIGKSVMRLEAKLGVQLLHRTTRRISLTDEGARFFSRCKSVLSEIEDAESDILHTADAPRGRLRISMPAMGYRLLLPLLPEFRQLYPDIQLDIDFSDRIVDLTQEGFDAVIRTGKLADSQLLAKPLMPYRQLMVASPGYLDRNGTPQTPSDLAHHKSIRYRLPANGRLQEWAFESDARAPHNADLVTTLSFNNVEAVIDASIAGLGLAYVPDFMVKNALDNGQLQTVLGDFTRVHGVFQILWPSSRHIAPRLRVFIDHVAGRLGGQVAPRPIRYAAASPA
ncbi:Transcriptional regulator, LysR family [Caballeronia glathei]|jgi:DNA-binding transcriptional LysR family regulator|uniref:LysR family transcriptional regulator n=2 Tax=Caballeronia glathei TaxID=60547 RepID=A0A069PR75_9BURK|nr:MULTISPECIES: LysR family transcriptional regulator [Burkholderiaceae]KDR43213.1 LysR family transcriptional regulator [Caballeronia glathei]TCK39577.1 LysR family transcriptional regulator [Paraburkholderia sp. BL8N3]CDY79305.1 Transcriptional regulator, LysR family [Caballeronia glathei]